jgi:hypothetical protein
MKIHISTSSTKTKRKDGDQKLIKGVLCERISERILMHGYNGYSLAMNHTGGRQNHEWVPIDELIGESPYKRRHYAEIDGKKS